MIYAKPPASHPRTTSGNKLPANLGAYIRRNGSQRKTRNSITLENGKKSATANNSNFTIITNLVQSQNRTTNTKDTRIGDEMSGVVLQKCQHQKNAC